MAQRIETEKNKTTATSAKQTEDVTLWYLTHKAYVRATRTTVANMVSRYISKEGTY